MMKILDLVFNFRSPLELNSFYSFLFHVIDYSSLVKTSSIPNVCSDSRLPNSSIINHEKTFCTTKRKLQTINILSDNLVTIVNNPSSLKKMNEFDLNDGICISGKIRSLSSSLTTVVNVISIPPKIWYPKAENKYKPMNCTDVDEDLYTYKYDGKVIKHI